MTAQLPRTWTSDNGDGTFTNPLFYDEFSDPDMIRVGDDYYLTGTTNHSSPGLPILHSKDLVNWKLLAYACERLDLGPSFRLEDGRENYGQGIWAPCFRFHDGVFHIFSNVNGQRTQHFTAMNPAGPWTQRELDGSHHDLSVLFDDDGTAWVIWGYQGIHLARMKPDLSGIEPESVRVVIPPDAGMGEGVHFYKIDGTYYITSAWFAGRMRMPCARAAHVEGPYEVNFAISADEDFGLAEGPRLRRLDAPPFELLPSEPIREGRMSMHQGGIIRVQSGEWWGYSMMDYNSVGRLTCLSPVTWRDGWPYFGLPGNLTRTPRTWRKPNTGASSEPAAPYARDDDFHGQRLNPIWQWNHAPDDARWSLQERPGFLRLHSLPANNLWWARNTLTQRAIGPQSTATVTLDPYGMRHGDAAGLALMNFPYTSIGLRRDGDVFVLEQYDQRTDRTTRIAAHAAPLHLRVDCDFLTEKANFSWRFDGEQFKPLGDVFDMIFQTKTFQGVRFALFHFTSDEAPGGCADFTNFRVDEPHPRGLMRPIPYGRRITITSPADGTGIVAANGVVRTSAPGESPTPLRVVDLGHGRAALESDGACLSVRSRQHVALHAGEPGEAESFQWMENVYGDLMLLSLTTQRFLCLAAGGVTADRPGPHSSRRDGVCLHWS